MTLASTISLPVLGDRPSQTARMAPSANGELRDPQGRGVGYLRLSLTKACSMRCTYCRPAKLLNPRGEVRLAPTEIEHLARHLAQRHGLHKVRLTGGDPTSRPELIEIIGRIASIPGIEDLSMTTNGLTLASQASAYRDAGLGRVNISLDTLDAGRFATLTGVDGLRRVLRGIDAAKDAGLGPIKINCVVVRDQNEHDLADLVRYAAAESIELRFIELMPMGPLGATWQQRYVPEAEMRRRLEKEMCFGDELPQGHDAARRYPVTLDDGSATTIGFITPMSCNFCHDCNRVRIAADGEIYPCLMDRPAGSLLDALRPTFDADRLDMLLAQSLTHKQPEHPAFGHATMTHLGG